MPRRSKRQNINIRIMPLFVIAVSLVFAFIYTVLLFPVMRAIQTVDIRILFVALLVASATVASVVTLAFYLIVTKKL